MQACLYFSSEFAASGAVKSNIRDWVRDKFIFFLVIWFLINVIINFLKFIIYLLYLIYIYTNYMKEDKHKYILNKKVLSDKSGHEKDSNKEVLKRRLNFKDMFFTGVAYMIGAGIFTLVPFVIKYGNKNAVLAFIIGGIACIFTGLSFARLNYQYPVNDAEYSWILEILKNKKTNETPKSVKAFAGITIWVVGVVGVLTMALLSLGLYEFINTYNIGLPKRLIIFIALAIPTIINMIGVKSVANVATGLIIVVLVCFAFLIGASGFKGKAKFLKQNSLVPDTSNLFNIIRASFLTIFAFNGFQGVVQMSEETISKEIIPKSILASVSFTTIIYALLVLSVVTIIGLKKASSTVYPISAAYSEILGSGGRNVVTVLSIFTMFSSLVIATLGVSRLFHKLSKKKIAPKYLSKLMPLDRMFSKEKFTNSNNQENSELVHNENKKLENKKHSRFDKMPIPALLTLFLIAFAITFIKGGVLELVANSTNSLLAFIFTVVNALVIVNHYKFADVELDTKNKFIQGLYKTFPWYSCIGVIISLIFLILSTKFYDLK